MTGIEGEAIGVGPLAAALAKAQSAFPAIARDKEVTVQTRTGGSYKFKYAPLDTIIAAVRGPLSDNGLAVSQLLDGDDLVTMLLHKDGGVLSGRVPLPHSDGETIQALGSAITYLRRYSLQAILGIAAEEDDDGNRASGNKVKAASDQDDQPPTDAANETLRPLGPITRVGAVAKGSGRHSDLSWREQPDGSHRIGFLLEVGDGKARPQVVLTGALGTAVYLGAGSDKLDGEKVTVTGDLFEVRVPSRKTIYRIIATSIETSEWRIPATVEAPSEPLPFSDDEVAAIAAQEREEAGVA